MSCRGLASHQDTPLPSPWPHPLIFLSAGVRPAGFGGCSLRTQRLGQPSLARGHSLEPAGTRLHVHLLLGTSFRSPYPFLPRCHLPETGFEGTCPGCVFCRVWLSWRLRVTFSGSVEFYFSLTRAPLITSSLYLFVLFCLSFVPLACLVRCSLLSIVFHASKRLTLVVFLSRSILC